MKINLGLRRVEQKPFGRTCVKTYYEDISGNRISKEAYEELTNGENQQKRARKKRERVNVPYDRQQLWLVIRDIDDSTGKELVFLKYAKSVPLDEWGTYPIYDGPFFEKK